MKSSSDIDSVKDAPSDAPGWARYYLGQGYKPIPVATNSQRPILQDWPTADVRSSNSIDCLFNNPTLNIGIVLGKSSNGLVDVMTRNSPIDLTCVDNTFENFDAGKPICGFSRLEQSLGHRIALSIRGWLNPTSISTPETEAQLDELDTEANSAEAFANRLSAELLYCGSTRHWYRRHNKLFLRVGDEAVQGMAMSFLSEAAEKVPSRKKSKFKSRGRINATVELARHYLTVDQNLLDSDLNLVGCRDGSVLDLDQFNIRTDVSSKITKRLGTSVQIEAACPTWSEFLNRIFDGDRDVISFVQRAVGYSLTGHVDSQCLFLLIGDGANGKTTFLKVLQRLFGDYAATTPMQTLTVQRGDQQTNDLARLVGKRFVSASEGEPGQKLAESKVKLMTGGDPISCRWLYQEFFEYVPQFKLWVATNNLPKVVGTDNAIWRRIHVVRFPITIPEDERDPRIADRMIQELPGLLNWALFGLEDWRKQGLKPPELLNSGIAYTSWRPCLSQT